MSAAILDNPLGLSRGLFDFALGGASLADGYYDTKKNSYPHPPALFPILSDRTGSYYGYWRHWPVDDSGSYVICYADSFITLEIARTQRQFVDYVALMILSWYEEINSEARELVALIGECDLDEVFRYWQAFGDDMTTLTQLGSYRQLTPQEAVCDENAYSGAFPCTRNRDRDYSQFEMNCNSGQELVKRHNYCRPWLTKLESMPRLFDEYVASKDYRKAWMTLNSSGWTVATVEDALQRMKRISNSIEMDYVAAHWRERSCWDDDDEY